jgi:hypothetical protein
MVRAMKMLQRFFMAIRFLAKIGKKGIGYRVSGIGYQVSGIGYGV